MTANRTSFINPRAAQMHPVHLSLQHETSRLQLSDIADRKFFARVGAPLGIKSSRTGKSGGFVVAAAIIVL